MEQCWTEPPAIAWVLIACPKRPKGRRLSEPMPGFVARGYGLALRI